MFTIKCNGCGNEVLLKSNEKKDRKYLKYYKGMSILETKEYFYKNGVTLIDFRKGITIEPKKDGYSIKCNECNRKGNLYNNMEDDLYDV